MVVGFLVLNMVVGIVVSNYQLCQEKQENADRKLKPPKTKEDLEIVDKTRYGKRRYCLMIKTLITIYFFSGFVTESWRTD